LFASLFGELVLLASECVGELGERERAGVALAGLEQPPGGGLERRELVCNSAVRWARWLCERLCVGRLCLGSFEPCRVVATVWVCRLVSVVAAQQQERCEHSDGRQFGSMGLLAGHGDACGRSRKECEEQQQAGAATRRWRGVCGEGRPLQKHGWLALLSG
jgi:hypothetical protein